MAHQFFQILIESILFSTEQILIQLSKEIHICQIFTGAVQKIRVPAYRIGVLPKISHQCLLCLNVAGVDAGSFHTDAADSHMENFFQRFGGCLEKCLNLFTFHLFLDFCIRPDLKQKTFFIYRSLDA